MTVEDVAKRIEAVREEARKRDHESAHALEDELRHDVLEAVAHEDLSAEDFQALARLALTTSDIEFERWCA